MEDSSDPGTEGHQRESKVRDELRTVAFRLRELQRLGSARVEQENRRLAADGLEPVTQAEFFRRTVRPRAVTGEGTARLVEELGALEVDDDVQVTLLDGTTVEGRAGPIDYDPTARLRVELTPTHETAVRYELRSVREDGDWTQVRVRTYAAGDDDWTALAPVSAVGAGQSD